MSLDFQISIISFWGVVHIINVRIRIIIEIMKIIELDNS